MARTAITPVTLTRVGVSTGGDNIASAFVAVDATNGMKVLYEEQDQLLIQVKNTITTAKDITFKASTSNRAYMRGQGDFTKEIPALVVAKGTATFSAKGTATKVIAIGGITYTFVDALTTDPSTVAYEVVQGANTAATVANLIAAVNGATGAGTTYGTGTVANPYVTASSTGAGNVTFTAKDTSVDGSQIALTTDDDVITLSGAALGGKVFGFYAFPGLEQMRFKQSDGYLYIDFEAGFVGEIAAFITL